MKVKIHCYDHEWNFKRNIENIKDPWFLQFSECVNGWQWGLNIKLDEKIDCSFYNKGDFIELIIFSNKYKNGIHKYTWVISGISRYISTSEWQWITLKVEWIVSLLSTGNINKVYSWSLTSVIDEFIADFHSQINISNEMEYLWVNILKNGVSNTENINISVNGNYINVLEKIFWDNRKFFIDKIWIIKYIEEIQDEKEFTLNTDITSIDIDIDGEIDISLSTTDLDIEVWQKVFVQNIDTSLDFSWKRIQELAFGLGKVDISMGKIINYNTVL